MPQPMVFHFRLGWSGWLRLALALAIGTAMAVLLLGIFILLILPVMVLGALIYYFFPGLKYRHRDPTRDTDVIEGEYRVVDPTRLGLDPPSDRR